jgi:phosphopantothenoylcysteine decarboxylase / phosphopantothenate---cysteine ligase
MGFALAEAARDRGAEVTVVAGVTTVSPPDGIKVITAASAQEMFNAVKDAADQATVFIGAAAVADYRPATVAESKIKKDDRESLTLELKKTPDILSEVSKRRRDGQLIIGFAAETGDAVTQGKIKLGKKGLDMVVANDITKDGAGFDTDTNIATMITRSGQVDLPLMSKREMADKILDEIINLRSRST